MIPHIILSDRNFKGFKSIYPKIVVFSGMHTTFVNKYYPYSEKISAEGIDYFWLTFSLP